MTLDQLPTLIAPAIILLAIFEVVRWMVRGGILDRAPAGSSRSRVVRVVRVAGGEVCANAENAAGGRQCGAVCREGVKCALQAIEAKRETFLRGARI
jgi:hypothetical protein